MSTLFFHICWQEIRSEVEKFFQPSVDAIMKIIESQCESATTPISVSSSIISSGLRCNLFKVCFPCRRICCQRLALQYVEELSCKSRPRCEPSGSAHVGTYCRYGLQSHWRFLNSNKAVADGAVSHHIDHFVSARVSKFSYGTECEIPFIATHPEHIARSHLAHADLRGRKHLPERFSVILPKVLPFRDLNVELTWQSSEEHESLWNTRI